MELYAARLRISRLVQQDQRSLFSVLSHIINPLLTKLVRSRWLDIGLVLFLRVYGQRRSRLINNPNISFLFNKNKMKTANVFI